MSASIAFLLAIVVIVAFIVAIGIVWWLFVSFESKHIPKDKPREVTPEKFPTLGTQIKRRK